MRFFMLNHYTKCRTSGHSCLFVAERHWPKYFRTPTAFLLNMLRKYFLERKATYFPMIRCLKSL